MYINFTGVIISFIRINKKLLKHRGTWKIVLGDFNAKISPYMPMTVTYLVHTGAKN